uniref:NADH-ubiquinone oxidoreductase chain 2 n=1 Tax=Sicista concolor TaxID=1170369 RepID=A0A0H3UCC5_9RODE|nr:NADH dehydrogenase subunit 2 [Sicista concolor]AIG99668.1 NADH dehydrogenase subunit 2 [Sicista concolor]
MNILTNLLIFLTVFLGTMITMSSSHLLIMWSGLELSMLAIIPILIKKPNPRSTEASTKYFLTQAMASMILLMAILLNFSSSGQWSLNPFISPIPSIMITTALLIKLGLAPFHYWVPEVTQGVTLMSGMLLLTWQKLAPMTMLYQLSPLLNHSILITCGFISILIGGWGGLNQTQLRKIMAYSSIAHMGWMISILPFNPSIMVLNLLIYIILTLTMFLTININSSLTLSSLTLSWNNSPTLIALSLVTLLSLGGLPPLTGFLPKWLIIEELVMNNSIYLSTSMAIMALMNLFFYLRLIYSSSLTIFPSPNPMKMKWQHGPLNMPTFLPTLIILSTLTLPLTPLFT